MDSKELRPVVTIAGSKAERTSVIAKLTSALNKKADELQAKNEEVTKHSTVARRLRPMKEIREAQEVYDPSAPPTPTNGNVKMLDGSIRLFYTDGSLRRTTRKLTKEERRAKKRAKRTGTK